MSIKIRKGENINLSKTEPSLKKVLVGLGWDTRKTDGKAFDLDASCFLVTPAGKCRDDRDVIYYDPAHQTHPDGSVKHHGDNRTGAGDGDDEKISVDLEKVAAGIQKLVFVVSIYDAVDRKQSFGMVNNAYIRLVNEETGVEVCKADLSEDFSVETSVCFAELYRTDAGEWKFKNVGQGYKDGLEKFVVDFGLTVG